MDRHRLRGEHKLEGIRCQILRFFLNHNCIKLIIVAALVSIYRITIDTEE